MRITTRYLVVLVVENVASARICLKEGRKGGDICTSRRITGSQPVKLHMNRLHTNDDQDVR